MKPFVKCHRQWLVGRQSENESASSEDLSDFLSKSIDVHANLSIFDSICKFSQYFIYLVKIDNTHILADNDMIQLKMLICEIILFKEDLYCDILSIMIVRLIINV